MFEENIFHQEEKKQYNEKVQTETLGSNQRK